MVASSSTGNQQSQPASRSGSLSRAGSDSDNSDKLAIAHNNTRPKTLCSGIKMDIWSMGITLFSLVFGGMLSYHNAYTIKS